MRELTEQRDMQIEDGIIKAVQKVEIDVNKEELIKALNYDRHQYDKGYKEGLSKIEWRDVDIELPSENSYCLVQWEHNGLKNIEWAYYNAKMFIAVRDSFNVTPKVVAWTEIDPYEREEQVWD